MGRIRISRISSSYVVYDCNVLQSIYKYIVMRKEKKSLECYGGKTITRKKILWVKGL